MTRSVRVGLLLLSLAGRAAAQQQPPADPPPEPGKGWSSKPFKVANKGAGFELGLKGYVQADFRSFQHWQVGDGSDPSLRAPEFEWRRLRIGVEGEWRPLVFEFVADPAFDKGQVLKDARLGLRLGKPLEIDGGHMKLPVSLELQTSAGKTDLLERSAAVDSLAPGRDWGGLVGGELGRVLEYHVGAFEGDARNASNRSGTTAAGRLLLMPAGWLALGGSFSQGEVSAEPASPGVDTSPKGLDGTSVSGYEFFPGVYVDGQRRRWGVDARLVGGPVSVWGEFIEAREERRGQGSNQEDLPDVRGRGWSATASWLVTGERKTRTVHPRRGLFAGPGAVELSARFEALWFDDVANQGFESAGTRAANIRPAGIRTFSAGLSWWPTSFLRFQGNALVERYDDPLRAPEPGRSGDYLSLTGRLQAHLP